jgi:hypothetical protein
MTKSEAMTRFDTASIEAICHVSSPAMTKSVTVQFVMPCRLHLIKTPFQLNSTKLYAAWYENMNSKQK